MPKWIWHCADCGTEVQAGRIDGHAAELTIRDICGRCAARRKRVAGIVNTAARQVARERQARIEAVLA